MKFKVIQEQVDVLKLLELLGITGKMQGDNLMTNCPVNPDHDDKSPSFGIKVLGENRGVWHCWGCGMKGNPVQLIMSVKGVSREEAEALLTQWFNLDEVIPEVSSHELLKMLESPVPIEEQEVLVIPLPRLSGKREEVLKYLMAKRRYTEIEAWDIINFYKMDFCDKGYYKGRIIIPIYDSDGVYVTFEADAINGEAKKKLYPNGSQVSRLLFNDMNTTGKEVCVCEGIMDVLRLRSFGIPAISIFGSHLSNYQAYRIIRKYEDVYLFFDGDKAGLEATESAKEILFPFVKVHVINVPEKDPDDLTREEMAKLWH